MRQMALIGFMQAQNCTNFAASWRHPDSRLDFMSAEFYQHIAKVLEAGRFHLAFFDDRLSMPEFQSGIFAPAIEHGIRPVKMDPMVCLMAMGMATKHLGLGCTYSTTYYEPFHVARMFATLDQITGGRAAWNIVTSLNNAEAANMGRAGVAEHDERYDMADEFLEVVMGHWDAWEDDALVLDRASGKFAHPSKVHRLEHKGKYFRSRGPFTVPRSAQGHPMLIQAGQSGRGKRFASEWGELIFSYTLPIDQAKASYADLKALCAATGRDPNGMRICNLINPVAAATKSEAEDKRAAIDKLPIEQDALLLLSEALNFDFGAKPMDEPFSDEELNGITGLHTIRDRVLKASGKKNPTVRDFIHFSGRGRLHNPWVGGPKEIADMMEDYFTAPTCDGFVIAATNVPGTYEDFVTHVVPELQRRGLFHKDYRGTTLRENLGFPKPATGAWRKVRRGG